MMLFCDSSALVKLYVAEAHSDAVRAAVTKSKAVSVSRIAWVEAHAAFARRTRETPRNAAVLRQARRALAADWPRYVVIELTQAVAVRAGTYADTFALRAYDAVQLASAHLLALQTQQPVSFACFDLRLNQAAQALGLQVPDRLLTA